MRRCFRKAGAAAGKVGLRKHRGFSLRGERDKAERQASRQRDGRRRHSGIQRCRRSRAVCRQRAGAHRAPGYRLVLIDDASPDPAVAVYFAALKRRALPHVVLLRNRRNRGFPGTRKPRHASFARRCRAAELRHGRHRRLARRRSRGARRPPPDRHCDAVLQQCRDLFVSAILSRTTSRAPSRPSRRGFERHSRARRRADVPGSSDRRGLLLLRPARS